jgi:tRNA (guanine-N7-)-methyltransferase
MYTADCVDWSLVFPKHCDGDGRLQTPINFADIGCGFGGLLVKLGENFPEVPPPIPQSLR